MNRLKYRQKFTLVGLVLVLPLIVLMAEYVVQTNNQIDFTAKERAGAALMPSLTAFLMDIQEHRVYSLVAMDNVPAARDKTAALAQKIAADVQAVDSAMHDHANGWQLSKQWQTLKGRWQALQAKLPSLTFQDSLDMQTEFAQA